MDDADRLAEELVSHDPLDVAVGVGALLGLAENNYGAERIYALSATRQLASGGGTEPCDLALVRRWIAEGPSLHRGYPWDPPEGLWVVPIQHFGGAYRMLTGGEPDTHKHLHLVSAGWSRMSPPAGGGRARPRGSSSVAPVGSRELSSAPDHVIVRGSTNHQEEARVGHDHHQRRNRDLL
jgi:hypothetical protein